jgi:hypothetical protein
MAGPAQFLSVPTLYRSKNNGFMTAKTTGRMREIPLALFDFGQYEGIWRCCVIDFLERLTQVCPPSLLPCSSLTTQLPTVLSACPAESSCSMPRILRTAPLADDPIHESENQAQRCL